MLRRDYIRRWAARHHYFLRNTLTKCPGTFDYYIMLKYGYEGTEEHKAEHQELINSVRELQQQYLQVGKLEEEEDLKFLEHWLTEHIFVADMKLGSFLIEIM